MGIKKTRLLLNPCDWSCCICIKQKTVVSSVSKWVHCWHHLPPQAMKAVSWMVYQSQQKASSQPPARQNEATSSSGRSRPPMNEKTSKKQNKNQTVVSTSEPPTNPCMPTSFSFDTSDCSQCLNSWLLCKRKLFLVHFFVQFILHEFEVGKMRF